MISLTPRESARLSLLPLVNRAREHRLYGVDGSRWVDLFLDGGRSLLGHRPRGLSNRIKNEIDRGLYAPYPSRWTGKLITALSRLVPGYPCVRIYPTLETALQDWSSNAAPRDPLYQEGNDRNAAWLRPFIPPIQASCLFCFLPLPAPWASQVVLLPKSSESQESVNLLSPLEAAAMLRSVENQRAAESDELWIDDPRITAASSDKWRRRGPYMMFNGNDTEYDGLFESLFQHRVLIPPSRRFPLILSPTLSDGERRILSRMGILT